MPPLKVHSTAGAGSEAAPGIRRPTGEVELRLAVGGDDLLRQRIAELLGPSEDLDDGGHPHQAVGRFLSLLRNLTHGHRVEEGVIVLTVTRRDLTSILAALQSEPDNQNTPPPVALALLAS